MRLSTLLVAAVLAATLVLWLDVPAPTLPAAPGLTTTVTTAADVTALALGVVRSSDRHVFAEQELSATYAGVARPDGLAGALGLREEYTAVIVGLATAELGPIGPDALAALPDGTVVLTLPAPVVRVAISPERSYIAKGADSCPGFVCGGYDRLSALQTLAPRAEAELAARAAAGDLAAVARANARAHYRRLLAAAGLTAEVR